MDERRGVFRVYLGAAPGVGKTFAMLNEGRRRAERGTDVVVAVVETHGRTQTAAQLQGLEVVPRRSMEYRGTTLLEMDLEAVLARRPDLALVDEYAHTNVPGSIHEKRWQDVDALLDAGIDVITTLNVQHLESLNDVVNQITGTVQRETVPDVIVRRAEQIELVDMTPEAIRRRMAHGNIYGAEKIDAALGNYFRPGNLGALRELALLWLADRVDEALHGYRERNGISDRWETRERVVVGLTGVANGEAVVRRASRMAGRLGGELVGVHVAVDDGLSRRAGPELEEQRRLVRELGGEVYEVVGDDPVAALVDFAHGANATQLVLGVSRRSRWHELVHGSFVARLARQATTFDVHVISGEHAGAASPAGAANRRHDDGVRRARLVLAAVVGIIALPLLTLALSSVRNDVELSTVLLVYLLVVLIVAGIGGRVIAVLAAVAASLLVNWYFVDPLHTFTITERDNVVALVVFVVVAAAVGWLVDIVSRRAREARRARVQAEALARSAANLAGDSDPLPAMLDQLRATFDLTGVRLRDSDVGDLSSGEVTDEPILSVSLTTPDQESSGVVEVYGRRLSGDEERVLRVVADQLSVAIHTRVLAERAATAATLGQIDVVRTAMLRSVSHDLRSPLASIKAMVSGLRDPDVHWSPEQLDDALATVENETDRLNRLVGNLLDASRLQSGALATDRRPTPLVDVVDAVIDALDAAVDVELPAGLPLVDADPGLLEQALANVVANACRFNPPGAPPVRIDAAALVDGVHLRVVDHGPGIARERRRDVLEPFQRLGDARRGDGVGLGLTIAHGFVTAMDGQLELDDTPGGGLTVTIVLAPSTEVQPCPSS